MEKQNSPFEITSVTTEETTDKLDTQPLQDLLNKNIHLEDYGSGVEKIFLVFVAAPPENEMHENSIQYHEEEKMVEVVLRLDYENVLTADAETILKMLSSTLLVVFEEIMPEVGIPDFEIVKLWKDLGGIFEPH